MNGIFPDIMVIYKFITHNVLCLNIMVKYKIIINVNELDNLL